MKKSLALFLSCGVLLMAGSCTSYNKVINITDNDYKYEEAKQYYVEGQYNRAAVLFQDVIAMLKGTDRG